MWQRPGVGRHGGQACMNKQSAVRTNKKQMQRTSVNWGSDVNLASRREGSQEAFLSEFYSRHFCLK